MSIETIGESVINKSERPEIILLSINQTSNFELTIDNCVINIIVCFNSIHPFLYIKSQSDQLYTEKIDVDANINIDTNFIFKNVFKSDSIPGDNNTSYFTIRKFPETISIKDPQKNFKKKSKLTAREIVIILMLKFGPNVKLWNLELAKEEGLANLTLEKKIKKLRQSGNDTLNEIFSKAIQGESPDCKSTVIEIINMLTVSS